MVGNAERSQELVHRFCPLRGRIRFLDRAERAPFYCSWIKEPEAFTTRRRSLAVHALSSASSVDIALRKAPQYSVSLQEIPPIQVQVMIFYFLEKFYAGRFLATPDVLRAFSSAVSFCSLFPALGILALGEFPCALIDREKRSI